MLIMKERKIRFYIIDHQILILSLTFDMRPVQSFVHTLVNSRLYARCPLSHPSSSPKKFQASPMSTICRPPRFVLTGDKGSGKFVDLGVLLIAEPPSVQEKPLSSLVYVV